MSTVKIAALVLIVAGALALGFGGFSYIKDSHHATVGPLELTVEDKQTVNVPVWAGLGAVAIGTFLLLAGKKS
jgi:hypothetical protein